MVRMRDIVKGDNEPKHVEKKANEFFGKDSIFFFQDNNLNSSVNKRISFDNEKIYVKACSIIKNVETNILNQTPFNLKNCFEISKIIVKSIEEEKKDKEEKKKSLKKNESLILIGLRTSHDAYDEFVTHSLNVAIYSVKIGIELKYNNTSLLELCTSSLVHDIGMLKIPNSILKKTSRYTDNEMAIMKKHPQFTVDLIDSLGEEYRWISNVVYQEHEREDGSGYPQGLRGDEINEYAKIIGITDMFEAMTHFRKYKKSLMSYHAIMEIVRSRNKAFAPKVIKALLKGLSIFPVGSYVSLNSREIGKVISVDERYPLRPVLEIYYNSNKEKVTDKRIVDLRKDVILFISSVITSEEEIENYLKEN